jgi:hypothetical protein
MVQAQTISHTGAMSNPNIEANSADLLSLAMTVVDATLPFMDVRIDTGPAGQAAGSNAIAEALEQFEEVISRAILEVNTHARRDNEGLRLVRQRYERAEAEAASRAQRVDLQLDRAWDSRLNDFRAPALIPFGGYSDGTRCYPTPPPGTRHEVRATPPPRTPSVSQAPGPRPDWLPQ